MQLTPGKYRSEEATPDRRLHWNSKFAHLRPAFPPQAPEHQTRGVSRPSAIPTSAPKHVGENVPTTDWDTPSSAPKIVSCPSYINHLSSGGQGPAVITPSAPQRKDQKSDER